MNYRRRKTHQHHRATLLGHTGNYGLRRRPPRQVAPLAPATNTEEMRRQAEIEQDLLLARDIQQGLLLEAVPRLPGWEISAVSLPARDLGGDLYDFLPLQNGWHGIMIGDVSGKGLPAALRMAVARTVFRHSARSSETPGKALAGSNMGVLTEIPQGMVTMLYAMLDTREGTLRIANAGHNYPLLINGQISEIELSGLPLGVDSDSDYEEIRTVLYPGDTILLYTDGVVEATNPQETMFGDERLKQVLQKQVGFWPRRLMTALLHELRAWANGNQADDITMVILRRRLEHLGAELRSIAEEVLDRNRSEQLWTSLTLPDEDAPAAVWAEAIPTIVKLAQTLFGRGLARELNAQMRLVLEEYR